MSGNTFGKNFTLTTFGESHGIAIGGVVDGCPPGIELSEEDIQIDLDRRKPGTSKHTTQRNESDSIQILSGVFEGKTTGTPIGLVIYNGDQKSKDYDNVKDLFRPGHADYTYFKKYGTRDYRGGGRSSARETAIRVAGGAIAKKYLKEKLDINIRAYLSQLGEIEIPFKDWEVVNQNPFFAPDADIVPNLEDYMYEIRNEHNSIGAKVNLVAENIPVGLGEPIFDRLDADLAHALMGINAVKGVEIGAGFGVVKMKGDENRDIITPEGFETNNAGGILGGISSGQDITASVAFKPTASLALPCESIDKNGNVVEVVTKGRHDPCVGIRGVPVVEAMAAMVIMDHLLRDRAQNFDIER